MNTNEVEESVVAKSTGKQDEKDMDTKDALLFGEKGRMVIKDVDRLAFTLLDDL
jgi:hypothetical protein